MENDFLLTELKEHSFEKEKEGAIEIEWNNDIGYSQELAGHVLNSTYKVLNGKYYLTDEEEIRYYKNGKLHRDDNLPSIIYKDVSLFYYVNGKLHRIYGPAFIYSNVKYYWYINGYSINNEVMQNWLKENNIPLDWNRWTESDKMLFAMHWSDYNG